MSHNSPNTIQSQARACNATKSVTEKVELSEWLVHWRSRRSGYYSYIYYHTEKPVLEISRASWLAPLCIHKVLIWVGK